MDDAQSLMAELADVSARIGADPLLVQGPGGNSSVKIGDAFWVKASGVWMAQAQSRPIFAQLSLALVRAAMAAGQTDDFSAARCAGSDPSLRPSIETALHALMPHHAVLHAHAVASMTVSVLADGQARVRAALDGACRWAWIPYCRPGAPLAVAIAAQLARAEVDVLVLQNHGVVVGAATPLAAEALLRQVEVRLAFPIRALPSDPSPSAPSPTAIGDSDYIALTELFSLAADAELCGVLTTAALFPDQIVFMGGAVPLLQIGETLAACAQRTHIATGVAPALILAPDVGAFVRCDRSASADAVIAGLFEVARRLPAGVAVIGLPADAAPALLGWDAEKYRLQLAAKN
jgi:rhamnose utilization protein RhaD (predicted bifunctional aldolase and dehydrogenase)